ncbi:carbohydrate-binding glycoside hydrolase, partial [Aspergillus japonicus CBS 114.51]
CAATTSLPLTFIELVTTTYGEEVYLTGSIAALGNWATTAGTGGRVALSAANYSAAYPAWSATVSVPLGTSFEYKFFKVGSDGSTITWESDPNRSYAVTATACAGATATVVDSW